MQCPLYKTLKQNGTSFYAFPGAAEDISAAYQNSNYRMYFSKYILLNLPVQNLSEPGGTASEYIQWDFLTNFKTLSVTQADGYANQVIESLRNYVANQEITIRESRINNTEYYYDNTALETTAEKIFWKWCKKLGLLSLEPALPDDEYFLNLTEFERGNLNDDSYFPEYLWRERESSEFTINFIDSDSAPIDGTILSAGDQALRLTFDGITNLRKGDILEVYGDITYQQFIEDVWGIGTTTWQGPARFRVLGVTTNIDDNHEVIVDFGSTLSGDIPGQSSYGKLFYTKLVQYIGEVNGISNVQEANKAYTEVYAHVPDHTGQTPDILFRTMADVNYKPGMIFPIIPNQYQPEIIGAELFSSPIVSSPQNYPGSYYGFFDTEDYTYEVENGDSIRRSGNYYGVSGDINAPVVDGSTVDGITVDFNTSHYVKMNLPDRALSTFDQFNGLEVNNTPPKDFEFNAILWYYTVEDSSGNVATNLYGISFLDHPDNNPKTEEISLRFPPYKKLATTDNQDGTSYAFALNLNFNIIHENPIEAYNPEAINSLFSMNLFNEAMRRLALANDSFLNIISEHSSLKDEILSLKQLLYSQTELSTINSRISNLETLLNLYSTMQQVSSETIEVQVNSQTNPPTLQYNSIDRRYVQINRVDTTTMYSTTGIIPLEVTVPSNKDFLINIVNNDESAITLDDNLKLLFTSDLSYRQSVEILMTGNELCSENKKLDIYITTINPLGLATVNTGLNTGVETAIVADIDLPVFYNKGLSVPNSAKTWKKFNFDIDFSSDMIVTTNNLLEMKLDSNSNLVYNSIIPGDTLNIHNLFIGTSSIIDLSGQYRVDSVGSTSSVMRLDVSTNQQFLDYVSGQTPLTIHSASASSLSNRPYLDINKGKMIRITRVNEDDNLTVGEKYAIEVQDLQY
jgi:hypothetical protein